MANGKGSRRRPQFVSDRQMADNWKKVYRKKLQVKPASAREIIRALHVTPEDVKKGREILASIGIEIR